MTKNVSQNRSQSGRRVLSVPQADQAVAEALNEVLGNTYALAFKAQLYRWNVTGPIVGALHANFSKQCRSLSKAANSIGNRIKILNPEAQVNFGNFQPLREVTQENRVPDSWEEMVSELIQGHQQCVEPCRDALQAAQAANDNGSVYLLLKRVSSHEKSILKLGNIIVQGNQSISARSA